jgi:hypothetical protein
MVLASLLQSKSVDIVEFSVDGVLYRWTKGDIVELMKARDKNEWDPYYVVDIRDIKEVNVYGAGRHTHTYRIWFYCVMDTDSGVLSGSKLTTMDIDDMMVKMRDIKLDKVLSNQS